MLDLHWLLFFILLKISGDEMRPTRNTMRTLIKRIHTSTNGVNDKCKTHKLDYFLMESFNNNYVPS